MPVDEPEAVALADAVPDEVGVTVNVVVADGQSVAEAEREREGEPE